MGRATYLHLIFAAVVVVLLIGLASVIKPHNGASYINFAMYFVLVSSLLAAIFFGFRSVKDKNSIWLKPVSSAVSKVVINIVVISWLMLVVGLTVVMLIATGGSPMVVFTILISVVSAIWVGGMLKRHFSNNTLLAYGLTFLAALIVILLIIALLMFSGMLLSDSS